jgi:hypothetical protein
MTDEEDEPAEETLPDPEPEPPRRRWRRRERFVFDIDADRYERWLDSLGP